MAPLWKEEVWGVAGIQGGQHVRMGADVRTGVLHTQRHQGLSASLQEIGAGVKRETEETHLGLEAPTRKTGREEDSAV